MGDVEPAPPRHQKFARGARFVLIDDNPRAGAREGVGGEKAGGARANDGAERSLGVANGRASLGRRFSMRRMAKVRASARATPAFRWLSYHVRVGARKKS